MRRRTTVMTAVILSLLLGLQSLAIAATDQLDQAQTIATGSNLVFDDQSYAQTITAGQTGNLTRVKLLIDLAAFGGATMTVELRAVENGKPSGTYIVGSGDVLTSMQYHVSVSDAPYWHEVAFDTPAPVVNGVQYAIVLGISSGAIAWHWAGENPYSGGGIWVSNESIAGEWSSVFDASHDFAFETYVMPASEPEPTYTFSGFQAPINPDATNIAKAGQTIPLKFRVTDSNGNPVSDLTAAQVKVTSTSVSCGATGGAADPVEEYATGKSGLQNQGNGYYQLNWATPKTYANSCRLLQLELGDGQTHTALFQFKK